MKKILQMIACTLCVFVVGCSDFLEEESQDEVIPETAKDFGELLLGSGYPSPSGDAGYIVSYMDDDNEFDIEKTYNLGSSSADNLFPYLTWQPNMFQWNEELSAGTTDYYKFYDRIKGCNAVLDYIDDAVGSQAERDQVKAEALALRALHYFWLVNLYGEPYNDNKTALGVPLKLNSSVMEKGLPRNTVEEVYEQIVEDLRASETLFEQYDVVIGNYKVNLPAVRILLSRVYLYMEEWELAAETATGAIATAGSLTDLTALDESASIYMNTYDHSEIVWLYGGSVSGASGGILRFSDSFLDLFDDSDRRVGIYFMVQNGSYIYSKNQTSYEPGQMLRTAEAYLNRAEAYAHIEGKQQDAMNDLNALRAKRIEGYQEETISDVEALIEAIRTERRKDLCFEGHRWFDLRRYEMPSIKHVFQNSEDSPVMEFVLEEKDPMYTLPLPASVTRENTALVQNSSAYGEERTGEIVQ